jgi:hypothetical protein
MLRQLWTDFRPRIAGRLWSGLHTMDGLPAPAVAIVSDRCCAGHSKSTVVGQSRIGSVNVGGAPPTSAAHVRRTGTRSLRRCRYPRALFGRHKAHAAGIPPAVTQHALGARRPARASQIDLRHGGVSAASVGTPVTDVAVHFVKPPGAFGHLTRPALSSFESGLFRRRGVGVGTVAAHPLKRWPPTH